MRGVTSMGTGRGNRLRGREKLRVGQILMEALEPRTLLSSTTFTPGALTSFQSGTGGTGGKPTGLIQDSLTGNLYGVTSTGGVNGKGTVFEIVAGSSAIQVLASFNTNTTGFSPTGGLVVDSSGNVFGTTTQGGGLNNKGTFFEVVAGSGVVTPLLSFDGSAGTPTSTLVTFGGNFFGTTGGGALVSGTLFEIHPTGSGATFTPLAPFPIGTTVGSGLVVNSVGDLFGTTLTGGAAGKGSVYMLSHLGSSIATLVSFDGTAGSPTGAITIDSSGDLYGTTAGASGNPGQIFKVNVGTGNGSLSSLATFGNVTTPGSTLVIDGVGNLYGTTTNGNGTLFELPFGTHSTTTLASFASSDGKPVGNIVFDSTNHVIVGITQNGGTTKVGSVFTIPAAGGVVTTAESFTTVSQNATGSAPIGLIRDTGGNLFGVTAGGGIDSHGTIFEIASGQTTIVTLGSFSSLSGFNPTGNIVVDGSGNVFGVTTSGGATGRGGIFEIEHGSGAIVMLAPFTAATGTTTGGLIIGPDNNVWGTTSGGTNQGGEVFELVLGTGTATITPVVTVPPGTKLGSTLVMDGFGNLFGTTKNGAGTVFEIINGSATLTTAAVFSGATGNPTGMLAIDSGGNVWGTTNNGGATGRGSVFEVVGGVIVTQASMTRALGQATGTMAFDAGDNLFFMSNAGDGQVLELAHGNANLWNLGSLAKSSGTQASGGLVITPTGHVQGTARSGGSGNVGAIFDVTRAATEQRLVITQGPISGTADGNLGTIIVHVTDPLGNTLTSNTSAVTLTVAGAGAPPLTPSTPVNAVAGVATFIGVALHTAGKFKLSVSGGAMIAVQSGNFTVTPGVATQLGYVTVPASQVTGQKFTVQVGVQDQFGNVVTTNHSTIILSVNTSPPGGVLGGQLTAKTQNGVATFSNLSLPVTGTYVLSATNGILPPALSGNIVVTQAPASIAYSTASTTATAGVGFNVIVTLKDINGAVVTAINAPVTISITKGPGTTLKGKTTVNAVSGVATFTGLSVTRAGTYTITVKQGNIKSDATLTINPAAATGLKILSTFDLSTGATALPGSSLGPVTVGVVDQFGNVITSDTSSVTLTATSTLPVIINGVLQPATPASTVTIAAVAGVATFPAVGLPQGWYTLQATDGTLTPTTETHFVSFQHLG